MIRGLRRSATPLLFCVALLGSACTTDPGPASRPSTRLAEPSDVLDEPLMIALSQAKNYHHKAKLLMADGAIPEALATAERILQIRFPAGAPEAEDVQLDARAFVAKLLVTAGRLDEALAMTQAGLAVPTRASFFQANLHTVQGEVYEAMALAHDLVPAQKAEAALSRRKAIEAYDRSIAINDALQARLLDEVVP